VISILLPSRKRPENLRRFLNSVRDTLRGCCEVIVGLDDDDPTIDAYRDVAICYAPDAAPFERVALRIGPQVILSEYWNILARLAMSDIFWLAEDDTVYLTPGWDQMVQQAFDECPDKVLHVHGADLPPYEETTFGNSGAVHRVWLETLGYVQSPAYFCGDYGDSWRNDLANRIGRNKYLPFAVEHKHPYKTGDPKFDMPVDDTYLERREREKVNDPKTVFDQTEAERIRDADKLRAVIEKFSVDNR
jgi:hypothetical protein